MSGEDLHAENERLRRALLDQLGGLKVAEMADQHFRQRISLARIADWHGVSISTAHRRIWAMRSTLSSYGLVPKTWRRPKPGRPAGKRVNIAPPMEEFSAPAE